MTTIYHNPRCSKSRQCLGILEDNKEEITIVKYLETPFTEKQLTDVLTLLSIKPIELVRKNEAIWKQDFKNKELSDKELIKIMCDHPKLIERPIVIKNNTAIIGRPPEKVLDIL